MHAQTETAFSAAAARVAKILREWSSITRTIATSCPSASHQAVASICHIPFGDNAWNRL
jgi:hypothetical protein